MHNAIEAVERNDVERRRAAVKRAMDIVIHLQATLKKDIGGKPAESLSDFYVAMFALMLQGSQGKFQEEIRTGDRQRAQRARCMEAGGGGSQRESARITFAEQMGVSQRFRCG